MEMYEKYLYERKQALLKTFEFGFISYKYFPEDKMLWVIDVYVEKHERKNGYASMMIDSVLGLVGEVESVVTYIDFSFAGGEETFQACAKYGFKWYRALSETSVELIKEIDNG